MPHESYLFAAIGVQSWPKKQYCSWVLANQWFYTWVCSEIWIFLGAYFHLSRGQWCGMSWKPQGWTMRNMHNQQLKIKVGPNHYSWTTNMLKVVLLVNFDQYGSRYLPSSRHLMDNQPHHVTDSCNDGDKPPTTLFDNHQPAKLPFYSILVKNCYFCQVWTSMTAY